MDLGVKGTVHHMEVVLTEGGSDGYQQWVGHGQERAKEKSMMQ